MALVLPRLSGSQPIAGALKPTSPFLQFMNDTRQSLLDNDATVQQVLTDLAQTQEDLQDQVDRLTAVLAGTGETFTGLSVGGVNVKPFLDRTDGGKITNEAALDTAIVSTVKVAPNAITEEWKVESAPDASLANTGPMTSRTDIFSLSFDAPGFPLAVDGHFYLFAQHDQDAYNLHVIVERQRAGHSPVDVFSSAMRCFTSNGDGWFFGWQNIKFTDDPPAGPVTYQVRVFHQFSVSAGDFAQWSHSNRFMLARKFAR